MYWVEDGRRATPNFTCYNHLTLNKEECDNDCKLLLKTTTKYSFGKYCKVYLVKKKFLLAIFVRYGDSG